MSVNLTRVSGPVWDTLDPECKTKLCPNNTVFNKEIHDTGYRFTSNGPFKSAPILAIDTNDPDGRMCLSDKSFSQYYPAGIPQSNNPSKRGRM